MENIQEGASVQDTPGYWAEVHRAVGRGTFSILLGTSNRALALRFSEIRTASGGKKGATLDISAARSTAPRRRRWRR